MQLDANCFAMIVLTSVGRVMVVISWLEGDCVRIARIGVDRLLGRTSHCLMARILFTNSPDFELRLGVGAG